MIVTELHDTVTLPNERRGACRCINYARVPRANPRKYRDYSGDHKNRKYAAVSRGYVAGGPGSRRSTRGSPDTPFPRILLAASIASPGNITPETRLPGFVFIIRFSSSSVPFRPCPDRVFLASCNVQVVSIPSSRTVSRTSAKGRFQSTSAENCADRGLRHVDIHPRSVLDHWRALGKAKSMFDRFARSIIRNRISSRASSSAE
jgi:hypothetical protein